MPVRFGGVVMYLFVAITILLRAKVCSWGKIRPACDSEWSLLEDRFYLAERHPHRRLLSCHRVPSGFRDLRRGGALRRSKRKSNQRPRLRRRFGENQNA